MKDIKFIGRSLFLAVSFLFFVMSASAGINPSTIYAVSSSNQLIRFNSAQMCSANPLSKIERMMWNAVTSAT